MNRLKQAAIWITLLSILLKLMGFVRESVIANKFGASDVTDGFLLSFAFVTLILTMVSNGFNSVFLPQYLKHRRNNEGNETIAERDASGVLNYTILIFTLMSVVLYFATPWLVKTIYGGMEPLEEEVTINMTQIFFLFMSIIALSGMLESYLQSLRSFVPTQVSKMSGTLFAVIFVLLFSDLWGIYSVAYGFVFGTFVGVVIQFYYLIRGGFRWRPVLKMDTFFLKAFLTLLVPAILQSSIGHINVFIDKSFATGTITGAVTYLNNASLLMSIPSTIFATTFVAIIFTLLSERADEQESFQNTLFIGYQTGVMVLLPIAVGLYLVGDQALAFIYERGEFTAADTANTFDALKLYIPMIVTQGLLTVSMKAMYARGLAKKMLVIAFTTIALNVALNYLLIQPLGYPGLALSSSGVNLYYFAATTIILYRDFDQSELSRLLRMIGRVILPTTTMAVIVYLIETFIPISGLYSLWQLAILVPIGMLAYVGATYVFYREGFYLMIKQLKRSRKTQQE